jgi:hypothetical protein
LGLPRSLKRRLRKTGLQDLKGSVEELGDRELIADGFDEPGAAWTAVVQDHVFATGYDKPEERQSGTLLRHHRTIAMGSLMEIITTVAPHLEPLPTHIPVSQ